MPLLHLNKRNKTEPAVFIIISDLASKEVHFQNLFIFTAAGVKCHVMVLKVSRTSL